MADAITLARASRLTSNGRDNRALSGSGSAFVTWDGIAPEAESPDLQFAGVGVLISRVG